MVLEIGHTSKSLLGEWAHPRAFPVFWLCACMTKTRALGPFSFIPNNSDNSLCELDEAEEHCATARTRLFTQRASATDMRREWKRG